MHTFSLDDICRAKTIPVEIKDDKGDVEGVVYLKEPSAIAGVKLQESITTEIPWHVLVLDILALTLSDADGNSLVNSTADRKKLESMPPRILVTLRDPCLAMLKMSWSTGEEKSGEKAVGAADGEDIDQTLANLDDQVAKVYAPGGEAGNNDGELMDAKLTASIADFADGLAIPIDGNENLHLDQDPGSTADSGADPTNPFVETAEVPNSPA